VIEFMSGLVMPVIIVFLHHRYKVWEIDVFYKNKFKMFCEEIDCRSK